MSKHSVLIFAVASIAGCAVTPEQLQASSDWEVCRLTTVHGQPASIAQQETRRRGLDCAPLYPAILANEQQRFNALMLLNQMNRPAPAINCTTNTFGNTANTTCR